MSTELQMQAFLRTMPDKIKLLVDTLEYNTSLLKQLQEVINALTIRMNEFEKRLSDTEVSTVIIN